MKPWLHIIGIGEDGADGLSSEALQLIEDAEVILGGDRHHSLIPDLKAERIAWPSPFNAMIDTIRSYKGRRFVILVTGDPLWYSVGARILKSIPAEEVIFHPQLSAFQWAAARMGWSLADIETLTVHGRSVEQIIPFFSPGARMIALTRDHTTPPQVARLLTERGYGDSEMVALSALGGPNEARFEGTAADWGPEVPDFHVLAITCKARPGTPLLTNGSGLPDDAFEHDGKVTKSEVRALTIARLEPQRGALLWDLGCGSGSVAIEWMRAARDAEAVGIDARSDRLEMARRNATKLGAPRLRLVEGTLPDAIGDLPPPNAIFIGGGLTEELAERCFDALKPHGRMVVNAVTLESEALLAELHGRFGGWLTRLAVSRAAPVGAFRGWKPMMPVTQWSLRT
jgi:precorrin-6B C5,15-methyltransferase / cobalt-precorrin-6B C5,C15-methyltransferase